MTHTQSRILLSVMALLVFSVLMALGFWQLQRRDWKNDLLARLEQGLNSPPLQYEPPLAASDAENREFTRVRLQGRLRNEQSVKLFLATPEYARGSTSERFGHQIFTPLEFDNGVIFVNRGFVPQNMDIPSSGQDMAIITGIIRAAEKPGSFTPPPELLKRLFYAADIPAMSAIAGLAGRNSVITEYIDASPAANAPPWPKPRDPRELLAAIPNRHLGYAATWFGLAATLIGVFGVYFFRS